MNDLFGNPILETTLPAKRKETPKGYAGVPGGGPKGETCGGCEHAARVNGGTKYYWKCALLKHCWTSSYGTDIRLKTAACRHWELASFSPFKKVPRIGSTPHSCH